MYPNELIPGSGIDLYVVFLCVAISAAILVFRHFADKRSLSAKFQNFCLAVGAGAILLGYLSAVLFQAFYNIGTRGRFEITADTGATFYGGLIGGAASFLLLYFAVGAFRFRETGEHKKSFLDVADSAACAIVLAHAFGRIGCLMAGCCHGARTDAWYGITMKYLGYKVVPLQLFEALYLFGLFVLLAFLVRRFRGYALPVYMCAYGVWRFLLEYLRDDYRGTTFVSFLTPSQLTAVWMILGGVALFFIFRRLGRVSAHGEEE